MYHLKNIISRNTCCLLLFVLNMFYKITLLTILMIATHKSVLYQTIKSFLIKKNWIITTDDLK